jgi:hypothetical protein
VVYSVGSLFTRTRTPIWGCKVVVRVSGGSGRENFAVGLFVGFFRGPKCGVFYPGYIELRF